MQKLLSFFDKLERTEIQHILQEGPMFVSQTTLEGLRVTIRSVIDLVDYIFESFDEKEFSYLLTGFLNQDVLEVIYFEVDSVYYSIKSFYSY